MKFHKITCIDYTKMNTEAIKELQKYSEEEIIHPNIEDLPKSDEEILSRIGNAEVIFVSWKTQISEEIIAQCPNLKYIGMCCSLYDADSANVAVNFAREKGIVVKGIFDYGDPGVAEFIIADLIRLLHGFGEYQWQEMPQELTDRKIGIIGLGATGKILASCLLPFGVEVYYYSRTRKPEWEDKGVSYLELNELLETCEIISIHLPKHVKILADKEFQHFGNGKIIVNTSIGFPFEMPAFRNWIKKEGNFAIFDGDAKKNLPEEFQQQENVLIGNKSAGWSQKTKERLSQKVVKNFKDFLSN
ncbi:NAD(P)-dependent oxidoreductase [Zunongwangia sp.]|uniref:NAD(P)-dependent oxidoreductase n=1 Tax=Zunongwangia sp. TaxID=1965325 RepID=UPI003AA96E92